MTVKTALLIVAAYLLGSIPTAYWAGKWLKGIDLRRYGSGTLSGSMVWEHVARWAIVPVGLFDIGKVALPTWVGLELDLGMPVAVAAGLAAVAGHNWSVYLNFIGGRGISGFLGMLVVIFPWGLPWVILFLFIGWRLGDSTVWALTGLITLPLLALVMDGPATVTPLAGAMLLLTLAKRLDANRRPLPPPGSERRRVMVRRLLFDRDIPSHHEWIRRTPEGGPPTERS